MITEQKTITPMSGAVALTGAIVWLVAVFAGMFYGATQNSGLAAGISVGALVVWSILIAGFFIVEPNGSKLLLLFGTYKGSVIDQGFYWANPFLKKYSISRRAMTLNGDKLKVNDAAGNPVEIAAIIVWQVMDTYKAKFEIDSYESYVSLQSETAIRHVAGSYPYDGDEGQTSLMHNSNEVLEQLRTELQARVDRAGIQILEARLSHLAYAQEIAGVMLRKQQASAIIAARRKIVDGAVGMVEMALKDLEAGKIVSLDDERKAAMVSNLMVVLCSETNVQPVVNAGTLYP